MTLKISRISIKNVFFYYQSKKIKTEKPFWRNVPAVGTISIIVWSTLSLGIKINKKFRDKLLSCTECLSCFVKLTSYRTTRKRARIIYRRINQWNENVEQCMHLYFVTPHENKNLMVGGCRDSKPQYFASKTVSPLRSFVACCFIVTVCFPRLVYGSFFMEWFRVHLSQVRCSICLKTWERSWFVFEERNWSSKGSLWKRWVSFCIWNAFLHCDIYIVRFMSISMFLFFTNRNSKTM